MARVGFASPPLLLLDGGVSSELEAAGFPLQGDPLWSSRLLLTHPDAVKDVHLRFLQSGSDVISTATYQASVPGFVTHLGLRPEEARQLIHTGVRLAREAVSEYISSAGPREVEVKVAGSVGPYGAHLHDGSEYTGAYVDALSTEELMDWHRPQVSALLEAGVDLLALETVPSAAEGLALVQLLREFPGASAWLSFSCKDSRHTCHGEEFGEVALALAARSRQLLAVGVNCCDPELVGDLLGGVANAKGFDKLLLAYPNSGEHWDVQRGWEHRPRRPTLATYSLAWRDLGVSWIGGCCRTGPEDIEELGRTLRPQMQPPSTTA
ncbi:LOW QUALITY PROTEIN: betaine-homocysteine S-methyltransferase-like [Lampetra fluviatilis]